MTIYAKEHNGFRTTEESLEAQAVSQVISEIMEEWPLASGDWLTAKAPIAMVLNDVLMQAHVGRRQREAILAKAWPLIRATEEASCGMWPVKGPDYAAQAYEELEVWAMALYNHVRLPFGERTPSWLVELRCMANTIAMLAESVYAYAVGKKDARAAQDAESGPNGDPRASLG